MGVHMRSAGGWTVDLRGVLLFVFLFSVKHETLRHSHMSSTGKFLRCSFLKRLETAVIKKGL